MLPHRQNLLLDTLYKDFTNPFKEEFLDKPLFCRPETQHDQPWTYVAVPCYMIFFLEREQAIFALSIHIVSSVELQTFWPVRLEWSKSWTDAYVFAENRTPLEAGLILEHSRPSVLQNSYHTRVFAALQMGDIEDSNGGYTGSIVQNLRSMRLPDFTFEPPDFYKERDVVACSTWNENLTCSES